MTTDTDTTNTQPKRLFRISLTAFKTFYVEAATQEEALNSPVVDDESYVRGGDVDWEFDSGEARELGDQEAESVRQRRSREILS